MQAFLPMSGYAGDARKATPMTSFDGSDYVATTVSNSPEESDSECAHQVPHVACSNCGSGDAASKRCHSCASIVCNFCMADEEGCCLLCLDTFPASPNVSPTASPAQTYDLLPSFFPMEAPFKPKVQPVQQPQQATLEWLPRDPMQPPPWMASGQPLNATGQWSLQEPPASFMSTAPPPPRNQQGQWEWHDTIAAPPKFSYQAQLQQTLPQPKEVGYLLEAAHPSAQMNKVDDSINITRHTMMLCNIPCRLGHDDIVGAIHAGGFADRYDFVYLPNRNGKRDANIGYAFVNFKNAHDAECFSEAFQDFRFPGTNSTKSCTVKPAHHQGYNAQQTLRSGGNRRMRA